MARVKIEDNQLIINMQGARKFLALKSTLSIPLENIQEVTSCLKWKDAPGIFQPRAGTLYERNIPRTR